MPQRLPFYLNPRWGFSTSHLTWENKAPLGFKYQPGAGTGPGFRDRAAGAASVRAKAVIATAACPGQCGSRWLTQGQCGGDWGEEGRCSQGERPHSARGAAVTAWSRLEQLCSMPQAGLEPELQYRVSSIGGVSGREGKWPWEQCAGVGQVAGRVGDRGDLLFYMKSEIRA